ncbi:uncharacterized protein LOC132088243 [Daphnia carinata]|uniref:uncharacterized protein LOC132088243 n=1 Tax=Daphnia carinata TaxID=120202 RepID=UPI00286841BC|nr:uncharacterized protein LOC132088243 [Daphnia carinata]
MCWTHSSNYKILRNRTKYYWTLAGCFLFTSAIVILYGSRQVMIELYQQHQHLSVEGYPETIGCGCDGLAGSTNASQIHQSTCSLEADRRGFNQSVVSYTLFGQPDQDEHVRKRYFASIEAKAIRIKHYYPGWIMRVYHNLSRDDELRYLCPLRCNDGHPHEVDLCHVDSIRTKEITSALIQRLNPRMWRFLVMLDPMVDRFMSRDVDSEIIPREVAAVKQWLQSNYTFHVMRDHPSHGGFMLAGLWGAKNVQRRDLIQRLGRAMIWTSQNDDYQTDQNRLDFFVWPFATFDVMAHDAYFCNHWALKLAHVVPSFPFPTRRIGHNFTGLDVVRKDIADHIVTCPYECRPVDHKDWLLC